MNVLSKVALQSLKKNKTRTIVTIIGIILSASMICAVTTFVGSLINFNKEEIIYDEGNWHARQCDTKYKTYEKVSGDEKVEQSAYLQQIGYANSDGNANKHKPYIYVAGASANAEDVLPIHITSGKYPTNSTEIILPEDPYDESGIKYKIGDTITLELGRRMLDGESLPNSTPCVNENDEPNGEVLEIVETRTYTVVGFYDDSFYVIENPNSPGITVLTIADQTPSEDCLYDVYFRMENPKDTYDFMTEQEIAGEAHTELLRFTGVFRSDDTTIMLYGMAAIVIILIMFGSVALIYNAFSISVSERTKQFGLLSSVGATKNQIRHMVLFEALSVSAIGIPLGILAGIGGIGITILFIGNKFRSTGASIDMTLYVSPIAIIIAIFVALITVLISAWIPSRRATKISAIDAIRQNLDIKTKDKNIKTSKLIYKLFGIPGVLADKHYKRSKRKYRTTILSLSMSIVLFVSASAFTNYLTGAVSTGYDVSDYDLTMMVDTDQFEKITPNELLNRTKKAKSVTKVTFSQMIYTDAKFNKKYLTEDAIEYLNYCWQGNDESMCDYHVCISFVDDATFKELLQENGLNEQEYMDPENPRGILLNGNILTDKNEKMHLFNDNVSEIVARKEKVIPGYYYDGEKLDEKENRVVMYKKDTESKVEEDDVIYLSPEEAYTYSTLKVGKVIDKIPYFAEDTGHAYLFYPYSLAEKVYEDAGADCSYVYRISSDNHGESYTDVNSILLDNGINNLNLYDDAAIEETQRDSVMILNVLSYGFIVLISLIAVANVFNTISTNVTLRRREFAMLKSIGMTKKEFNKMLNFECLLYGTRALLYGLPLSCIVTYLIYFFAVKGYNTTFYLPWGAIGIAVLSVFLVVFATTMYSMRKIKKDNPIDVLKNENI